MCHCGKLADVFLHTLKNLVLAITVNCLNTFSFFKLLFLDVYVCTGWLGVKHQLTYLFICLTLNYQAFNLNCIYLHVTLMVCFKDNFLLRTNKYYLKKHEADIKFTTVTCWRERCFYVTYFIQINPHLCRHSRSHTWNNVAEQKHLSSWSGILFRAWNGFSSHKRYTHTRALVSVI